MGKGILVGVKTTQEQYEKEVDGYTGRSFDEAKACIIPGNGIKKTSFGSYTAEEIARADFPNIIIPVLRKVSVVGKPLS